MRKKATCLYSLLRSFIQYLSMICLEGTPIWTEPKFSVVCTSRNLALSIIRNAGSSASSSAATMSDSFSNGRGFTRISPPRRQSDISLLIKAFSLPMLDEKSSLSHSKNIWIEDDPKVTVHGTVFKPAARETGIPWGVQEIKAPQAWSLTTGRPHQSRGH